MLERMIWDHVKVRYLSEKGQGVIEYTLLIAFAVVIGVAVYSTSADGGLKGALMACIGNIAAAIGVSTP